MVPATRATCSCHSPGTPSAPCSPVSVPVQAPPPWGMNSILVHFQSLLPSLEAANQSPRPGKSSQVGLLPDLSRLPPGWQFWNLRAQLLCYANLFCVSSMMLHDAWNHAELVVSLPQCRRVTYEGKIGGGDSQQSLLPTSSCPQGLVLTPWAPPCSDLKLPSSGWGCVSSDGSSF